MATYDGIWHDPVALNVSHLEDKRTTRRRTNRDNKMCCGQSSIALIVLGISLIFLGVVVIVFGTLCAATGVQYGITGDTLIKPWRALPLGGIAIVSGALGIRSTRSNPRRTAIATMLLSSGCAAWAAVVVFSYSFDVSDKSQEYTRAKEEFITASISRDEFAEYRKNKMDLALRDFVYFSGAVAFATMTAIAGVIQAAVAGLYISDPGTGVKDDQRRRSNSGGPTRNIIGSMTKVFVNYKNRAALATGIIQTVCGSSVVLGLGLALATEHDSAWASYVISHGILFIASGIVGAMSATSKTRPFVTASMIMSLIAAVAAVNLICSDVAFIINSNTYPTSGRSKIDKLTLSTKLFAIHGLDLFVNLIQLITAISLSCLGCHVTCDVAAKADDTKCLVSYVEIGQTDRWTDALDRTDGDENDPERSDKEVHSLHLPDILHESMTTEDDIFGTDRPQYMAEAMVHSS